MVRPIPVLLLASLALPACLRSDVDMSATDIVISGITIDTTDSSSTTAPPDDSSSSSDSGAEDDGNTTGNTGIATTDVSPCDDDPACGPLEDLETCPAQCSVCGDGIVSGAEACDNGVNNSTPYYDFPPNPAACAAGCVKIEYCGDGILNGPEPCDDGGQSAACETYCQPAICGDGILNPLAGEACDDSNAISGDGCADDCAFTERRVFVSSITVHGDFDSNLDNTAQLLGLDLADARCNALADDAGLAGTYKAWLSDSQTSPKDRFDTTFTGRYILLDGGYSIIATGWADLTDGTLAHELEVDENGEVVWGELMWTNTGTDGARLSDSHCNGWTSRLASDSTAVGVSGHTDADWTDAVANSCAGVLRFYCFEDP
jgi:cysteine-rich repeat protein